MCIYNYTHIYIYIYLYIYLWQRMQTFILDCKHTHTHTAIKPEPRVLRACILVTTLRLAARALSRPKKRRLPKWSRPL